MTEKMSPVLKWAGGKTQLLDSISVRLPKSYNNYYEPFIGSAAVLLHITPRKAFINDINRQLINLYVQLKNSPESIIKEINSIDASPCNKDFYYFIREKYNMKIAKNEFDPECAALMIWLNKHCFNGLYRVNSKGYFNVPYNNKTHGKSIDEKTIWNISRYLQEAEVKITCMDFEEACADVTADDFVYFDSPYIPESETASFTDYTMDGFSFADHKRLSVLFKRLDSIGAKVMLSNNNVPLVHELYSGYNIQLLDVKRMINRDATKRKGEEVLITNY